VKRSRVVIELELNGSEEDAFRVVENLLDAGVVQDAVNVAATDLGHDLVVTSAVTVLVGRKGKH
jgi:hypothetical protein